MEYIYGALLLHKLGKKVDEASMKKVIEAAGATVDESKIKSVVASLKDLDIDKELEAATLMASAPVETAKEDKKEEKKEEVKPEEAAEGLASLFG